MESYGGEAERNKENVAFFGYDFLIDASRIKYLTDYGSSIKFNFFLPSPPKYIRARTLLPRPKASLLLCFELNRYNRRKFELVTM